MILDFTEIPQANKGGGLQDTFELFARDFLQFLGYRIIDGPDRGADGKKDMIVEEVIKGITCEYTIRWLVSCKHFAHSGSAVKDTDEINISERLKQHNCKGFMGFYSTLPAVSLNNLLKAQENYEIFDHEKIENLLLERAEGHRIAARFFPKSFANFQLENPVPAKIFSDQTPLCCEHCGKDLMNSEEGGLYALLVDSGWDIEKESKVYKDIYFSCKGECDRLLQKKYREKGLQDMGWESIDDLCNPSIWIMKIMAFINGDHKNHDLDDSTFEKVKKLFIHTYPYIARHMTSKEQERVKRLLYWDLI